MANIYVYYILLPDGIHEVVVSGVDCYTIYIDRRLSDEKRKEAYDHAIYHIKNGDLDYNCERSVQQIEYEAHYGS